MIGSLLVDALGVHSIFSSVPSSAKSPVSVKVEMLKGSVESTDCK